jgi:hypothetical protein
MPVPTTQRPPAPAALLARRGCGSSAHPRAGVDCPKCDGTGKILYRARRCCGDIAWDYSNDQREMACHINCGYQWTPGHLLSTANPAASRLPAGSGAAYIGRAQGQSGQADKGRRLRVVPSPPDACPRQVQPVRHCRRCLRAGHRDAESGQHAVPPGPRVCAVPRQFPQPSHLCRGTPCLRQPANV